MTEKLSRTSVLASRHKALGSGLEDWNGMGTAWTYHSDPNNEHDAIREGAGMFDMSPLKKVFVRGAGAVATLDHLTTRDISKIAPGSAAYLCVLTEKAGVADDAIVSNNGDDEWMIVHGSGDTMALLEATAKGNDVQIEFTDDLHDLPVQGPKFCDIWDQLVKVGMMPCSFTALDKVRIEAGLLFYGYDMSEANTPWEVGLGFTISKDKGDFRGKSALASVKGNEVINNVCLDIDHSDMVAGEEILSLNGTDVGVVNSPCYSHRLNKSLALAHINSGIAIGNVLQVSGGGIETTATIVESPIYDPKKSKTHE